MKPIAGLGLGLALVAAPALALDGPQETIKAFYAKAALPVTAAEADRFFAPDLARAYKADQKTGEVGALGFDFRYNAQDFEAQKPELSEAHTGNDAVVTARVRPFADSEIVAIAYRMCLGRTGWKIADAAVAGPGGWSVRELLALPAAPVKC